MPRTLLDRKYCRGMNGVNDLSAEMENIAKETEVSLDEMMSLACRQGKLDIVELLLESGVNVDYRNKAGNTPLLEACSQGHKDVAEYLLDHEASIDAATDTTSDSALTWACTLGNESIVQLLLTRKSNVEHRTKDGCTALMFAALAGHVDVATLLLDCKANINVESDSNKDSPLTFACWKGHVDVVKLLLERNANIEHRTKEGFTPLMFSALGGHTTVAKELLKKQAKVNEPSGSNNDIPLTSACWKGHHEVVKLLLEYKSNIEHRTKDGCTPLMLAAREGHLIVAQLILDAGAEVNVPSGSENNIPLTLACWKGHSDVVELLLNHNSNIEHKNKAGCTPLMLAAREGHLATAKLLLHLRAEVNNPSGSNDDTPLTLACWKGHHEVVRLLVEHNSYVDHQTKTGCTPLMEATREGHEKVVLYLLQNGADVELPDNYGQSPLFMACWKGHRNVAELLLRNNANRECRTKTGITPLFQACRENHVSVVELLLDEGASVTASFPNSRENPMTLAAEKGYIELMDVLLSRGGNVDCRTKKGCSPFFLACKEGHLEIARSLYENSADIEVCDQRNISPLVAAFKNGHQKVVEWILSITKHVPSEEQCQKCITAPCEEKDNERDLLYLRSICYEMIKKAKKVKEQTAFENAQSFLQELEDDKVREEIKKKKQAEKRRDKRKKKKKQKENDQQNTTVMDELQPLENRSITEDYGICSDEETNMPSEWNHVEMKNQDWNYDYEIQSFENKNVCGTTTVGHAQDEKGNTNSTEERRDDQPQAMFDASDQNEDSHNKRQQRNNVENEKNLKNKSAHMRLISPSQTLHHATKPQTDDAINDCMSDEEDDDKTRETIVKCKFAGKGESGSSSDSLSRGNSTKMSSNQEGVVKDGWKSMAQRAKQMHTDYLSSWKEVARNRSLKTMVIQLTAPNALCGRVIGRGGSKINKITEESGAQITIGKPDPKNPNDRVITIKGSVLCVLKAKALVSNALVTPSTMPHSESNSVSTANSLRTHSLTQTSTQPLRGNFVVLPRSQTEWPTVVQAHSSSKVEQSLKKLDDNKSYYISEQTEDTSLKNAHKTRAHSVPDFQTVLEKDDGEQDICHEELNASSTPPKYLSTENTRVSDNVHKTTTASSATKARTKSYATTQDGSRLSYCEVATGIDIASSRDDELFQESKPLNSISATSTCYVNQRASESAEDTDNVFTDDRNKGNESSSKRYEKTHAKNDNLLTSCVWKNDYQEVDVDLQSSLLSDQLPKSRHSIDILQESCSLFSGMSWSPRDSRENDKARSISWSGQDSVDATNVRSDLQSTQSDLQSNQCDLHSSHSMWNSAATCMQADNEAMDSSGGWENSNSASSSRSSSRLELSSIMENGKNVSTSSLRTRSSPDPIRSTDVNDECQGTWVATRGVHSAPSSPLLLRSRDERAKHTRSVTSHSNSYDDMSDRLWSSKQNNDDRSENDVTWNANTAESQSSFYGNHVNAQSTFSPRMASLKQYEDAACINNWSNHGLSKSKFSSDLCRLLERLSLTKYQQTFEEHCVSMEKLSTMTDADLQKIGIPKGPRLKIIHAVQRGKDMSNGKVLNERMSSDVQQTDMLGHVPGSGTLLKPAEQNLRTHPHMQLPQVMHPTTHMLHKQHADPVLNPAYSTYLNNPHYSLVSLDSALPGTHFDHSSNGFNPQQPFVMPAVARDQYDPQSTYLTAGIPYQQQMFYPRPPGAYYYYP